MKLEENNEFSRSPYVLLVNKDYSFKWIFKHVTASQKSVRIF